MHAQLCLTLWTPWTVACQALLFMEFSRQEYWNRLPFLSPGDLPNSGMELGSLASPALAGRFFITVLPGKPMTATQKILKGIVLLSDLISDLIWPSRYMFCKCSPKTASRNIAEGS